MRVGLLETGKDAQKISSILRSMKGYLHIREIHSFELLKQAIDMGVRFDLLIVETERIEDEQMEILSQAQNSQNSFPMVLITDMVCSLKGFSFERGVYFLSHNFEEKWLVEILQEALNHTDERALGSLMIHWNKLTFKIPFGTIIYMDHYGRVTHIHSTQGEYQCTARLDVLKEELPDFFASCHKSYLVNMSKVIRMSSAEVVLNDGSVIPISRSRLIEFREKYKQFLETI